MKNKKIVLIVLAVVVAVLLLCVFIVQGFQNRAIALSEQVETASSNIEVQEKRRVDLLYNLVDCVKEYDAHEANTLKDVVASRGSVDGARNVAVAFTAVAEAYPELKSNENYKQLMSELAITENMVAEYRNNYNSQVKQYNRYVKRFPNRLFLSMLNYETEDFGYLEYDAPESAPQNLFGED